MDESFARDLGGVLGWATWCISGGGSLVPLVITLPEAGPRLQPFGTSGAEDDLLRARARFADLERSAVGHALLLDTWLHVGEDRRDALVVQARSGGGGFTVSLPYQNGEDGFGLPEAPTVLACSGPFEGHADALRRALVAGARAWEGADTFWPEAWTR